MTPHRLYDHKVTNAYRVGPRGPDYGHCEWGVVVGDRVRRLRRDRDMTLQDLSSELYKPDGGQYSAGHLSRIERGWATAPLYVYLAIADVFGTDPGRLLGQDAALVEYTDAEATLIKVLRLTGTPPEAALAALARRARDE